MQSVVSGLHQTPRSLGVGRSGPVEQSSESQLLGEMRLELNGTRIVVTDEATVAADAERRAGLLINPFGCAGTRKVTVFKRAFLPAMPRVPVTDFRGREERPTVDGDAEQDLAGRDALRQEVRHRGIAGRERLVAVRVDGRDELSVMSTGLSPRTGKIIGHEVNEVQMATGLRQVDVPQRPFAGRERRCERVRGERERGSQRRQQLDVVIALLRVGRMLPVD